MKKTYQNYRDGDFARYTGDMTIKSGILRDESIGIIEKFEAFNDKVRVMFRPIGSQQAMWVDFEILREIETDWKHLEAIGFDKIQVGKDGHKYSKDGITISGMQLSSLPQNGCQEHFWTRLCIGDFQHMTNSMMEPFFKNGHFDESLFFHKYPSVYNINRLFEELDILGVKVDKTKIVQL